jgi:hypothetical protein
MSENAIDSENISKPAPGMAKPKGARKAGGKTKPAKKAGRAKKARVIPPDSNAEEASAELIKTGATRYFTHAPARQRQGARTEDQSSS